MATNVEPKITKENTESPSKKGKNKRSKKKKKKAEQIEDPMKILASVLEKSTFKVPDLSQIVEQKFYRAPDYKSEISKVLKKIDYEVTVGDITDGQPADVNVSVLPKGFLGQVNIPPTAILNLPCIYDVPKRFIDYKKIRLAKKAAKMNQKLKKQNKIEPNKGIATTD